MYNYLKQTQVEMVRGDTFEFVATFDDLAADLSAAEFTVKPLNGGNAVISKELNDGITKIATGKYDVKVDPADTATVSAGTYAFDFEVTTADGDVYTIMLGTISVMQDITA